MERRAHRVVASDPAAFFDLKKLWHLGPTSVVLLGVRAAGMKRASWWRSPWIRYVSTKDDAFSLAVGIGYRNRRK